MKKILLLALLALNAHLAFGYNLICPRSNIFPGETADIGMTGHDDGKSYLLKKIIDTNNLSSSILVSSTPTYNPNGSITFSGPFEYGSYMIFISETPQDMPTALIAGLTPKEPFNSYEFTYEGYPIVVDKNGGTYEVSFGSQGALSADVLNQAFSEYNAGVVGGFKGEGRPHIELTKLDNTNCSDHRIKVTFAPAINQDPSISQSYRLGIKGSGPDGTFITFSQPGGGELVPYTVSYRHTGNANSSPIDILLSGSQSQVTYYLYRDNAYLQSLTGTGQPLTFTNIAAEPGLYRVLAMYGFSSHMIWMNSISPCPYLTNDNISYSRTYHAPNEYVENITYYDDFGRAEQSIAIGGAPSGKDIVNFTEYDNMGRADAKSYLPFATTSMLGQKTTSPVTKLQSFYSAQLSGDGDAGYPYAEAQYDNLPTGVLKRESTPGLGGNMNTGHVTQYSAALNGTSFPIKKFIIDNDGSSLRYAGNYAANTLTITQKQQASKHQTQITVTNGENQYTTTASTYESDADELPSFEYTDSFGQVVAREVRVSATDRRISYYVYDDLGRQRYVIPPVAEMMLSTAGSSYTLTNNAISDYCYYTEYDQRGRVVRQYAPGAGYTLTVYDAKDRVVMTQRADMRDESDIANNKWFFTKYDKYDRPVITGERSGGTWELHRAACANLSGYESRGSAMHGYTNSVYPIITDPNKVLTVTYYDDYNWVDGNHAFVPGQIEGGAAQSTDTEGLVTGTKKRILGNNNWLNNPIIVGENSYQLPLNDQWITSATYYDRDYRVIQTVSDLYPVGREVVSNRHDFSGRVATARVVQQMGRNNDSYYVQQGYTKRFDYDPWGRLLDVKMAVDGDTVGGEVTVARHEYDDLGRVCHKWLHNNLDTTTLAYNIRGQLADSYSRAFAYYLNYDKTHNISGATPRYDGKLSMYDWARGGGPKELGENKKMYILDYDPLGQLTAARSRQVAPNQIWTGVDSTRNEQGITYDLNGNILSISRFDDNAALSQQIAYSYNGNQLDHITVNGTQSAQYEYDAAGNMTFDGSTGVGVEYNVLGLPERIFAGTEDICYIYLADGTKLAQRVGSSLTYYCSVMVYTGTVNSLFTTPQYILQPEGVIACEGANHVYKYFKTDHLGSTRMVLAAVQSSGSGGSGSGSGGGSGGLNGWQLVEVQSTDYYPFGLAWELDNLNQNKYLFSGKELQDAQIAGNLLGLYDFGARYYDPKLGRWFNPDPAYQLANPYIYCGNNPHIYVDPNGQFFFSLLLPGIGTLLDAACWGAVISGASYTLQVAMSDGGFNNWNWGQFGTSLGMGAISGALTFGVGDAFGATGSFWNEVGRGLVHGHIEGVMSGLQGGDYLSGFASGALGSWAGHGAEALGLVSSKFGAVAFSTLSGGVGSWATGGSFLQGAANGLMVGFLNQVQHWTGEITEKKRNIMERIKESSLVGEIIYSTIDDPYVALQCLAGEFYPAHLDGSVALPQEKVMCGVSASASVMGPLAGAAAKGLGLTKALNAAEFNAANKGTGVTAATKGGAAIRQYNNAVRSAGSGVSNGSQTLKYLNVGHYMNDKYIAK